MGGDIRRTNKITPTILVVALTASMLGATEPKTTATAEPASIGFGSVKQKLIMAICEPVQFREICIKTLSEATATDPRDLIRHGFKDASRHLSAGVHTAANLMKVETDPQTAKALDVCIRMLDLAIYDLEKSFDKMGQFELFKIEQYLDDVQTWLGGAVTYRETCLDALSNSTSSAKRTMEVSLKVAAEINTNALAMVNKIQKLVRYLGIPPLFGKPKFPSWIDSGRRKVLESGSSPEKKAADMVVAKDGSGDYKTLNEALANVPARPDNKTFTIHVEEGVYERVEVPLNLTHLVIVGDGSDKTIFTGKLNFKDGILTVDSASFSILGSEIMVMNVGFENTAGSVKEQAVALHVGSDMAIIYNCSIMAFQDTLYAHAHRQFYRDCTIGGTIDFIFGMAAAVFQNCRILNRKPLHGQHNMITAHGRTEPGLKTGFVIQNCTITGEPDYIPVVEKAYLGRPWKPYARTLYIESHIDDSVIEKAGWAPWPGVQYEKTCWFAELGNKGPGAADLTARATWIKKVDAAQVAEFLPENFIFADHWIEQSGVPFSRSSKPS